MRKTCEVAGTRERVSDYPRSYSGPIQALHANTQGICVGNSNVVAAAASRNSIMLEPGESIHWTGDLSNLYLDVLVAGEGIATLEY